MQTWGVCLAPPPPGCRPPWMQVPLDDDSPPPGYGQQSGGMHATGMHTCFKAGLPEILLGYLDLCIGSPAGLLSTNS